MRVQSNFTACLLNVDASIFKIEYDISNLKQVIVYTSILPVDSSWSLNLYALFIAFTSRYLELAINLWFANWTDLLQLCDKISKKIILNFEALPSLYPLLHLWPLFQTFKQTQHPTDQQTTKNLFPRATLTQNNNHLLNIIAIFLAQKPKITTPLTFQCHKFTLKGSQYGLITIA